METELNIYPHSSPFYYLVRLAKSSEHRIAIRVCSKRRTKTGG